MCEPGEPGEPDEPALSTLLAERPRLVNLGYRLLGSLTEAEDAVQEMLARWYALPPEKRAEIDSPGAWATTVTGRICLDALSSARSRRERYVGAWLPEPVPGGATWLDAAPTGGSDPVDRVALEESVSMAFLVLLESLTPAERVTFVLHDVFGFTFVEVAEAVGRTPAACRQLAVAARRRVRELPDEPPSTRRRAELVRDFKAAWQAHDIAALVELLDDDASSTADGGGRADLTFEQVAGADEVARAFVEILLRFADVQVEECVVNGQPGLVTRVGGQVVTVLAFDVHDDRITRVWVVRNPDKLGPWVQP